MKKKFQFYGYPKSVTVTCSAIMPILNDKYQLC